MHVLALHKGDCFVQSVGAQELVESGGTDDKGHLAGDGGGPRISVELGITDTRS